MALTKGATKRTVASPIRQVSKAEAEWQANAESDDTGLPLSSGQLCTHGESKSKAAASRKVGDLDPSQLLYFNSQVRASHLDCYHPRKCWSANTGHMPTCQSSQSTVPPSRYRGETYSRSQGESSVDLPPICNSGIS